MQKRGKSRTRIQQVFVFWCGWPRLRETLNQNEALVNTSSQVRGKKKSGFLGQRQFFYLQPFNTLLQSFPCGFTKRPVVHPEIVGINKCGREYQIRVIWRELVVISGQGHVCKHKQSNIPCQWLVQRRIVLTNRQVYLLLLWLSCGGHYSRMLVQV